MKTWPLSELVCDYVVCVDLYVVYENLT